MKAIHKKMKLGNFFFWLAMIAIAVIVIVPVLFILFTSMKSKMSFCDQYFRLAEDVVYTKLY